MAFFGLFQTREQRENRAKIRFRQGKSRIQRFLGQARQSAERYWQLAKQAQKLGDTEQVRQLAANFFRARDNITRWERFLLKMDALEMRRTEVEATGEFLKGMNALSSSILAAASPEEIAKMQADVERAVLVAEQQQEAMTLTMDATGSGLLSTDQLSDDAWDHFQKLVQVEGNPAALEGERTLNAMRAALEGDSPASVSPLSRK